MSVTDVWLNRVSPRDLDPAVIVADVREHPPAMDVKAVALAGGEGSRLLRSRVTALSVSVDLELHEPVPQRRRMICGLVARWAAKGGWLTWADRPGQRLRVTCDAPPVVTSALRWTQTLTVTFTARELPCWESLRPLTIRAASPAASGALTLRPPGDKEAPLEAEVTAGAAVAALTLTLGGQALRLSSLGMAPGEALLLGHDGRGLTRLIVRGPGGGERSVLHLREPESDDELLLEPRADNEIRWEADGPVLPAFMARGRWL